jgi:hypothetical protein
MQTTSPPPQLTRSQVFQKLKRELLLLATDHKLRAPFLINRTVLFTDGGLAILFDNSGDCNIPWAGHQGDNIWRVGVSDVFTAPSPSVFLDLFNVESSPQSQPIGFSDVKHKDPSNPWKRDCPACAGTGEVDWKFQYGGEDYVNEADCPVCHGAMFLLDNSTVELAGALFLKRYVHLISLLPNPSIEHPPSPKPSPYAFTFDGGKGLVMPVQRRGEDS